MHDERTVQVQRNRTLRGDLQYLEEIVANWPDSSPIVIELSYSEGQAVAQFLTDASPKSIVGVGKDFQAAIRELRDVLDVAIRRNASDV
jgi:hypothetical protein